MRISLYIFIVLLVFSCAPKGESESEDPGQRVIERAISASGGDLYLHSRITFDFRDMSYVGQRSYGNYSYERIFEDSLGQVHDVLTNDGFTRSIDGQAVDVIDSMAQKYTNSVNSVLYFALLPYGLNDPAVYKKYLGDVELRGQKYDKVQVTFQQEGGGVDYQDVFVYWINSETSHIDYFGYTYETDGGGKRFREAYNPTVVEGIRFQDYINYKPNEDDTTSIIDFDRLLQSGSLEELSRIELKNITVEIEEEG